MGIIEKQQQEDAVLAGRAFGAMLFAIFGGVWIGYWCIRRFSDDFIPLGVTVFLSASIFMLALTQYRRNKAALEAEKDTPERRKSGRTFNIVNTAQWVLIVVGVNVLANTGYAQWQIPFGMFVIGAHFLPLAHAFSNRPHYLTGGVMMTWSVAYPFLLSGGPTDPLGCLGAGLILWGSATWAVRASLKMAAQANSRG